MQISTLLGTLQRAILLEGAWEAARFGASLVFVGLVAYWLSRHQQELRKIDPRNWCRDAKSMGRRRWAKFAGLGVLFAIAMLVCVPSAIWFTEVATGGVELVNPETHPTTQVARVSPYLLMALMAFIPVVEEWLFRGILLERLRRFGKFPAIILSAIGFGLFHLLNPGTFCLACIPPTVAGIILGVCYLSGGLKLSCLSHILYNQILIGLMLI